MSPRVRLFLLVFAAGAVLVAVVAAGAYLLLQQEHDEFESRQVAEAQGDVRRMLDELVTRLDAIAEAFTTESLGDAISDATTAVGVSSVQKILIRNLEGLKAGPQFVSVRGPADESWLRRFPGHVCDIDCKHPVEGWVSEARNTIVAIEGEPFAVSGVNYGPVRIYFGIHLPEIMKRTEGLIGGRLAVIFQNEVVYSGVKPLPKEFVDGDRVTHDGNDYRVHRERSEDWDVDVCILVPAAPSGRAFRFAAVAAGGGMLLSLLVALLVSTMASVPASRPTPEPVVRPPAARPPAARPASPGPAGAEPADRREVTMLFLEVRDFAAADEGGDPARVIQALDAVLERAAGAIAHHGGKVAFRQSGGLMAMFGAPRPLQDHARKGLEAAVEVLSRFDRWKGSHSGNRAAPGGLSLGVHTGIVVGGNVGAGGYTLVGSEVRIASRLCASAAAGQILASRRTVEASADAVRAREVDPAAAPDGIAAMEVLR